jgi:hypothetical protein
MKRRAACLELNLTDAEFQALKRMKKRPVDYRNARLVLEEVSVREIIDQLDMSVVAVNLRLRVDDTVEDAEAFFRAELDTC